MNGYIESQKPTTTRQIRNKKKQTWQSFSKQNKEKNNSKQEVKTKERSAKKRLCKLKLRESYENN